MLIYLALGLSYGFACAVQPGPLLTFLISQTLRKGWRSTLPAALSPLLSDGPIALLALLVLGNVPARFVQWLRLPGGVFVLYLAWGAWVAWRRWNSPDLHAGELKGFTVLKAAAVNLLNPNPYLGWSLVLGPLLLKGWGEAPGCGIALLAGFYGAMVASLAGIILVFHVARGIGERVSRALVLASAVALACFGLYQLWLGVVAAWPQ